MKTNLFTQSALMTKKAVIVAKSETKKENVLQQPNYILDGMSEVEKINGDLLRRLSLYSRLARHNNNV